MLQKNIHSEIFFYIIVLQASGSEYKERLFRLCEYEQKAQLKLHISLLWNEDEWVDKWMNQIINTRRLERLREERMPCSAPC